ncbi:uncharacterized protein [Asterias amurensis]|uniref:uncharacterized protein n=1 Tax=Asterias amurensis TaxID=7602 RepID=UPI003AB3BB9C
MASTRTQFGRFLWSIGKIFATLLVFEVYSLQHVDAELTVLSVKGKSASQSKTYLYDDLRADKAVDGSTTTYFRSGASDPHPWWRVDFDTNYDLGSITVTLRAGCCGDDFIGAVARAGLSPNVTDNQQCGLPATVEQSQPGAVITFICDPSMTAKYVSLDIANGYRVDLHIAEVTVQLTTGPDLPLIGYPTSQHATRGDHLLASSAIDGQINIWSETKSQINPWWRLDLGDEHLIGRVNVTPRADCCGNRFIGVTVRAGVNLTHTKNQQCGSPATAEQSVEGVMVGFKCDPPAKARYVSLDINDRGKLDIAEVTVEEYSADVGNSLTTIPVDPTTEERETTTKAVTTITGTVGAVTAEEQIPTKAVTTVTGTVAVTTVEGDTPTKGVTSAVPTTAEVTVISQSQTKVVDYPKSRSANFNRIYKGSSIGNPDPLSTEVAWNLKRCAARCVVHDLCYIFDFAPRTGRCHLYKLLDKVIPKHDSDFYIYELAKCLSELSICKN